MTEGFDRRTHRFPESRYFEDLAVGERFYIPSRTVTEANFAAFQTVSADNHPIHYDIEYCRERGHPGPLAHGFQVLCFTAAGAGTFAHVIGDSLIAFIEQFIRLSLSVAVHKSPCNHFIYPIECPLLSTHGYARRQDKAGHKGAF